MGSSWTQEFCEPATPPHSPLLSLSLSLSVSLSLSLSLSLSRSLSLRGGSSFLLKTHHYSWGKSKGITNN